MRIFVAGATGVLGTRVVPLLVAEGHDLWGMTRSPSKVDLVRRLDAEPVVCDVFDLPALRSEVAAVEPDAVVHLLTDLPDDPTSSDGVAAANARIRREGTTNLLTATRAAGVRTFIAESVAWTLPGDAGRAVDELERAVLNVGGVVLRYGQLYGSGTWFEREPPPPPKVHVDEAARRTAAALNARSGVITILDPTG
jgi:nucleoside-diphosphate-sugar epimerase